MTRRKTHVKRSKQEPQRSPLFDALMQERGFRHTIGALDFWAMRESVLQWTRDQCAQYLGVNVSTLSRWETGRLTIPYMAYELLRILLDNRAFKANHPKWARWTMTKSGVLWNEEWQLGLEPDDLERWRLAFQDAARMRLENERLRATCHTLTAENQLLQKLVGGAALTQKLLCIRSDLDALLAVVHTDESREPPKLPQGESSSC